MLRKDVSEALYAIPSDKRRSFTYIYVLWLEIIVMVAHPLFSQQTAISMKIHIQMKPSSKCHQVLTKAHHTMYHVTYSMTIFNDTLRGLRNVLVFHRFL